MPHRKWLEKSRTARLRILFLEACLNNDVIPTFLRFRIPENGCFEPTIVHNFQRRLLKTELNKARQQLSCTIKRLDAARGTVREGFPSCLLPSVLLLFVVTVALQLRKQRRDTSTNYTSWQRNKRNHCVTFRTQ